MTQISLIFWRKGLEIGSNFVKEVNDMEDKKIICKDCGAEFTFTVGEQEFYKEKGFENEPQRCPECRAAKKRQRNNYN